MKNLLGSNLAIPDFPFPESDNIWVRLTIEMRPLSSTSNQENLKFDVSRAIYRTYWAIPGASHICKNLKTASPNYPLPITHYQKVGDFWFVSCIEMYPAVPHL